MNINDILKQVSLTKGSAFFYTPPVYKNSRSYYFKNPSGVIISKSSRSLESSIKKFQDNISGKKYGYCLINYEAGYAYEKKLRKYLKNNKENLFAGFLFSAKDTLIIKSGSIDLSSAGGDYKIKSFYLNTKKKKYVSDIIKIKKLISAGDTYQVNYTVEGRFKFDGDVVELCRALIFKQSAGYIAFINAGDKIIISVSPELFFHQKGDKIVTKPMKGTIRRGINLIEDEKGLYELGHSEKDKAENVMIVDLLRNDLGRICRYGTVKVKKLFDIEKYETLFQMTSEIEGKLKPNLKPAEILKNIFPCGSITGAPKIRTMEIIRNLEKRNRGIYTGSVGIALPGESIFNVAIRTIELNKNGEGKIGIGSGIVWDSEPEKEYKETLLKSDFLTARIKEFSIFETLCYENGELKDLEYHLERMEKSAGHFLFIYNEKKIRREIIKKLRNIPAFVKRRVKIEINKPGDVRIIAGEFPSTQPVVKIIISGKNTDSSNQFQYFKTTNRELYDEQFAKYSSTGFYDVIFINENNLVSEGAISNIFIRKGENWLTPPLNSGILAGIERRKWLSEDVKVSEKYFYTDDLISADEIVLTNSLRGRKKVDIIYFNEKEFREF